MRKFRIGSIRFANIMAASAAAGCAVWLAGCLVSGKGGAAAEGGQRASVRLTLAPAALLRSEEARLPAVDSLRIRISAEDMPAVEFTRTGDSLAVSLEDLPPGENRLINAWLYRRGRLLYAGHGIFAFRREARTEASLRCDPQFSRVTARFHLPAGLPAPVRGGLLKLSGVPGQFTAPLQVRDEFGSFLVDELPGDARYDVSMALSDSLGKVRFQADRPGVYLPLGEEAKWDLSLLPTEAAADLSLGLGAPKEAVVETAFPAVRRKPARAGEAVVSGFYAAPADKDSGSAGEWFSVFNRTADTLALAGCRLSRDRSGGVTRAYAFDSSALLLPGKALGFGRPASGADILYSDFSLVNTASPLLLLCNSDSILVDSLRYSAVATDSVTALPMKEGWTTRLGVGSVGRRGETGSWCLSKAPKPGAWVDCALGQVP